MVSDINNRKTGQPQGLVFSFVQCVCSATASITDIQLANPPYGTGAEQWADYIAIALDESGSGHNNHNRGDE